jgi:hypothetical protein
MPGAAVVSRYALGNAAQCHSVARYTLMRLRVEVAQVLRVADIYGSH